MHMRKPESDTYKLLCYIYPYQIKDKPMPLNVNTYPIHLKRHRKSLKKWLMANGYSRNMADKICILVGLMKGHISYGTIYIFTLLGGRFV